MNVPGSINAMTYTNSFYSIITHPLYVCKMCDMRYDTFPSIEGHLKDEHNVKTRIAPPPAVA